jgi:nitrogenase-stabilizing/protective protein
MKNALHLEEEMTMTNEEFEDALEELSSAEDFLLYFNVEFDQRVVHVNRLHILQRFNDYLAKAEAALPENADARFEVYAKLLTRAYQDFVESDAQTEKVFKVFRMNEPQQTFVSIDMLKK